MLESLWGATLASARIFPTVSHRHVYGLLFSVLWPLLNRRPFATFRLEFPEQLVDGNGSGNVLVSSPALLKRIGHLDADTRAWRAGFSSGGGTWLSTNGRFVSPAACSATSRLIVSQA